MAGATLTTVDAALKETWTESDLAEQIYQGNPFLERVRRIKSTQVGQQAVTPIHVSRNAGYTAFPASGATLNAAGNQGMAQATWQYTHHAQQVRIEGSAIDGTSSDALSVAEVVDTEVSGALDDLNRRLTRQLFGNGDALITACGTTTSSTTVVLNVTDGWNAIERGWLGVGDPIDIGTTANEVSVADAVTITAVTESPTAPTITISGSAVTTSSANYVSLANSRSGTTSYEMNGLTNIVSTSATLGGLTVASNPTWAAAGVDSTSQALTLALIYGKDRQIRQKTGKDSTMKLTGLKQAEAAYKLGQAQVRFAGDSKVSVGNIDAFDIAGMTVARHPDCQNEKFYFLTIEDFRLITAGDPYWQSKITGGKTLEWIQGTDAYGAKIVCRMQLGLARRNSQAALTGLS
jgi:hypothetical protein